METREKTAEKRRRGSVALLFPAVLFYNEILFRVFTTGAVFRAEMLLTLLLCCIYGAVGQIVCTLSKNRKVNRTVALALLFLMAVPYIVEALVYREFKIFYDLRTVFGGANDVATGFLGEIGRLIFSGRGLLLIGAYLLPFLLYLVLGRTAPPRKLGGGALGRVLVRTVVCCVICAAVVQAVPAFSRLYGVEYAFSSAVDRLGFMTGLGLDVRKNLFGRASFELAEQPAAPVESAVPDATAVPVESTVPVETAVPEETSVPEQTAVPAQSAAATPEPTKDPASYPFNMLDLQLTDDGTADDTALSLNAYVSGLTPSRQNAYTGLFRGKNLILISAEAFSAEVIDPDLTPTLYRLATKGIQFTDYYQPAGAGTTGGEYQNIYGLLPTEGGTSFMTMSSHAITLTMGTLLGEQGYYGKAFHNNTYTYYDRDQTHNRLGYSDGYMGYGNGMEEYVQEQWPQSDYEMISGTAPTFLDRQPFNIYYMTVSGHNGYDLATNAMTRKHWDEVKNLEGSDTVKGYLAANLDLEDALTWLVTELENRGIADNTVICLSADHFPYGLDDGAGLGSQPNLSELYGYEPKDSFQRDHNRLILWCGALEKGEPIVVDEPTSSLDILPTLANLFGVSFDSRLMPGRDVFSDAPALVFNMVRDWKTSYGTYLSDSDTFTPAAGAGQPPEGYVDEMKTVVSNKINYCQAVLDTDYYTWLLWR